MTQQQAKYYTPSIEEFHVGFEFEHYYENHPSLNDGWGRVVLKKDVRLKCFQDYINEERVRIKYLDDTDLKELGWETCSEGTVYTDYKWMNSHILRKCKINGHLHSSNTIFIFKEDILFNGKQREKILECECYNKNELKFLMDRLGIKSE